MNDINILIKGALLHDIGKVYYRAGGGQINHSALGAGFIEDIFRRNNPEKLNAPEVKQMINCIRYHHHMQIDEKKTKLRDDDLCYIVYEADNIAAAMDRRDLDEGGARGGFDRYMPLTSLFHIFGGEPSKEKHNYRLMTFDSEAAFNYPTERFRKAEKDLYVTIFKRFCDVFKNWGLFNVESAVGGNNNVLLKLLENLMCYVPSSTNCKEVPDISLFIHSKITAAIASCMKLYFDETKEYNYKKYCFDSSSRSFRNKDVYLLVKGELRGRQDFLYAVPSKGALKSLRGRSFYLEVFVKQFVDELLDKIGLSAANILHCEGGSFYLLLPNTPKAQNELKHIQRSINKWLLQHFNYDMYFTLGIFPCNANQLIRSDSQHILLDQASSEVNFNSYTRYDGEILKELFSFDGKFNALKEHGRECSICHTSSSELLPYGDGDTLACPNCINLYKLGEQILAKNVMFVISNTKDDGALDVFGIDENMYLYAIENSYETLSEFAGKHNVIRIYSKNEYIDAAQFSSDLYIADYSAQNNDSSTMTFDSLAQSSLGIKRLGLLCLDVDDFEAAFAGGFIGRDNSFSKATFARYANLSQNISYFFKSAVNKICEGNLSGIEDAGQFDIFYANKSGRDKPRKVHIIYSADSQLVLVGAWNEVLETAVDIYQAFKQFTEGKMTVSAGMAVFSAHYPVSRMIDDTKSLLKIAKDQPGKDSIALFGFDTNQMEQDKKLNCRHVYKWEDFIENVCQEKLDLFLNTVNVDQDKSVKDKLEAGKSLLYRLLDLMDINADSRLNLARFAYVLARMQPKQKSLLSTYNMFSNNMYKWMSGSAQDKKELHTALNLLIYYMRKYKED